MKSFSKVLAVFFAILFVVTTALAFVLYNLEQSLFDAELYLQAFEKENLYQRLPDLTAQVLDAAAQEADSNNPLTLLRNLSEEEWEVFMTELLPSAELETLSEDAVRQIMALVNGETDQVVLSLASLKNHMSSPQGIKAIFGLLKAQPDCTIEQLTNMALGQQEMTLCNPPETFLFVDLQPMIESQIKVAVSFIPEQVILVSPDANRTQEIQDLKGIRALLRLSPLVPIFCLLMITVLAVRSLGDWLNWWGYPLWLSGLFSIALIVLSGPLTAWVFRTFVVPVFPEALPLDILEMFEGVVSRIAYEAVLPTAKIAGLLILIGLIMVGLAFLFRKKLGRSQIEA
jgi:hypothetical protein